MADFLLFKKTRDLETKTADFLTNINQAGFIFGQAVQHYLEQGVDDDFNDKKNQISTLEATNDTLRRDVENQLYTHMILPDMRSDILKLLEGCDRIINKYESDTILLGVEKPVVPKKMIKQVLELVQLNLNCVSALIEAVRYFFAGSRPSDQIQFVLFLEHQIDDLALELKRIVFEDKKLSLSRQLQLKVFIYSIEKISDMAEDVADLVTVMAAKHAV